MSRAAERFINHVVHFPVLSSTQDEAKRRALAGAPEWTVVLADRQTAGRGRRGRRWRSPRGGLWFSLLLRPALPSDRLPSLALVAALAWAQTIHRTAGLPARVKWPNDLWVNGRKVGGILSEMGPGEASWVVLGCGLNVNNRAPAQARTPADSLSRLASEPLSPRGLLEAWLPHFAKHYARYLKDGFSPFRRLYGRYDALSGRSVVFQKGRGRAQGVDAQGRLKIVPRKGSPVIYDAGEIQCLRG